MVSGSAGESALVLGASGAAALGLLSFPLPLEIWGLGWGCPLVGSLPVPAGILAARHLRPFESCLSNVET